MCLWWNVYQNGKDITEHYAKLMPHKNQHCQKYINIAGPFKAMFALPIKVWVKNSVVGHSQINLRMNTIYHC